MPRHLRAVISKTVLPADSEDCDAFFSQQLGDVHGSAEPSLQSCDSHWPPAS